MRVVFGNTHPISHVDHPDPDQRNPITIHYDHIEQTESAIDLPNEWRPENEPSNLDEWSRDESFRSITHPGGMWANHSADKPAWVECPDWPALETVLRLWYGIGSRPEGWDIRVGVVPQLRAEHPSLRVNEPDPEISDVADPEPVAESPDEFEVTE